VRYASDLADPVRDGSISLDNAYEEARIRKGRADTHESRFNALKVAASDLADLVVEGQLNLEEAEAAYEERLSQIRRENIGVAHGLHALAQHAYLLEHEARRVQVAKFVVSEAELYQKQNPDPIDEVVHALEVFAAYAGP
jgi:polyhydroxyalkanoate synthesis regulator phasin